MSTPARSTRSEQTPPGLAIVANAVAPYRVNLHRRLAEGIPEMSLHSIFTHGQPQFDWQVDLPESIHPVFFAEHDESPFAGLMGAPWTDWRKGGRIINYLQEHDVRAVVCHGYNYFCHLRVMNWCHRRGIPCFLRGDSNIRGDHASGIKQWIKRRYLGWVRRRVDAVLPVGSMCEQYYEKYGFDRQRMFRVTFEPDYEAFSKVEPTALQSFMTAHDLLPDRHHIVYCGRLHSVKRVDLLLDAFTALASERPDWDLLVVGDGPLKEDLARRVPAALRDRVRWMGFLDVNEVRLAYHASHLMVLPSAFEPWALVVQEAQAAGLVVIASDVVGAAADLVVDGENGYTFPSGDRDGLTERLRLATEALRLDTLRRQVEPRLTWFRRDNDPVAGMRAALTWAGVLPPSEEHHAH